ncbi:hypothetical protein KIW84_054915 [Lathyrus oleraceus]|uniref:Uncharacterized protein n=1 Tax=Pisum sativum TaxID=3888 RepID=A0A9D5AJ40_PEA|nr:hypothetical protein KIW84_054915 [Pisum sativum]
MVEDEKKEVVLIDRNYEVVHEHIEWECNGMVARIHNDVSLPVIQQSISDVEFHDFMVAPLGGDKIFLYFTGKTEVIFLEDLEFGLADNMYLVEYDEENESYGTELDCEFEDVPLVDNLMNQLQVEWSAGSNEMRMGDEEHPQEVLS